MSFTATTIYFQKLKIMFGILIQAKMPLNPTTRGIPQKWQELLSEYFSKILVATATLD